MTYVVPTEQTVFDSEKQKEHAATVHILEANEDKLITSDEIKIKVKKYTICVGLIVLGILNVIEFLVGVSTTKDCPIQPIIPIYLIVAGSGGLLIKIIAIINRNKGIKVVNKIVYFLLILEFVWMICGSYWIYHIYPPNYISLRGLYCNKTVYLLAFWLLSLKYLAILFLLILSYMLLCYFCGIACRDYNIDII